MLETLFNQGAYNQYQTGLQETLAQQVKRQAMAAQLQDMAKQKQEMEFAAQKQPLTLEQLQETNRGLRNKNQLEEDTAGDLREAEIEKRRAAAEATRAGQMGNRVKAMQEAAALGRGFEGLERTTTLTKTLMAAGINMADAGRIAAMPQDKLEAVVKHLTQSQTPYAMQTDRLEAAQTTAQARAEAAARETERKLEAKMDQLRFEWSMRREIEGMKEGGRNSRHNGSSADDLKRYKALYGNPISTVAFGRVQNALTERNMQDPKRADNPEATIKETMDFIDSFQGGRIYQTVRNQVVKENPHNVNQESDYSGLGMPPGLQAAMPKKPVRVEPPVTFPSIINPQPTSEASTAPAPKTSYTMDELKKIYPKATEKEIRDAAKAKNIQIQ